MDPRTVAMDCAKSVLDRHGVSVREFAEAYQVVPGRLLDVEEVAAVLNLSKSMVYKLMDSLQLRPTRVGTRVGVRADVLAEYVEAQTAKGGPQA